MGLNDLWWIALLFIGLQPVIRQKVLEASRLARPEAARAGAPEPGHRARAPPGDDEPSRAFPLMRYIDVHDSEEVLRAIELTDPDVPIDLVVHTPGGLVLAAGPDRARAQAPPRQGHRLRARTTRCRAAPSSRIAADEIAMAANAVLGPVDPQLGQLPAASILSVLERKEMKDIEDQTLILADVARKALVQVQIMVRDLLMEHMTAAKASDIAVKLVDRHLDPRLRHHRRGGQGAAASR